MMQFNKINLKFKMTSDAYDVERMRCEEEDVCGADVRL